MKECVLYNRECINCNECNICDLDSDKICDNCGKCISNEGEEFREIIIDEILFEKNYDGDDTDD